MAKKYGFHTNLAAGVKGGVTKGKKKIMWTTFRYGGVQIEIMMHIICINENLSQRFEQYVYWENVKRSTRVLRLPLSKHICMYMQRHIFFLSNE